MQQMNKETAEKYLKGHASDNEANQVESWYDTLGHSDERISDLTEQELANTKAKMYTQVKRMSATSDTYMVRSLGIAASVAILIAASILLHSFFVNDLKTFASGEDHRSRIVLADGTVVTLNENSSIEYPKSFEGEERRVYLKGEAFFKVARNESKPFIVTTNDLDIKVLGTSFNIDASKIEESTTVTVEEGKVAVLNNTVKSPKGEGALAVLVAEEQLVYKKNELIEKRKFSDLTSDDLSWHKKELIFRNETFEALAKSLSAWYGVAFTFENPVLKTCLYTANMDNDLSIEQVLQLLKEAQDFEYQITEKRIIISGDSCNQ